MSAGAFLLSVGNPKKRYAFPSCTIMMHQMATNFGYNQTDELHVRMTEHDRLNKLYISILAKHMKKSEECVVDLMRNTNYMGINKALDLGIIDCVLNSEIKPTITRLI
jgi:ATP-dependent protease ClpP protease subunit